MFPRDGEDDAVQDGEHDETGDNRDGEQSDGVLGMQHLGEGAPGVAGPRVPTTEGRQTKAEDDGPDDGDPRLGRCRRDDGGVSQREHDGDEAVNGDGEQIERGADGGQDYAPEGEEACDVGVAGQTHSHWHGIEEDEIGSGHPDGEISPSQAGHEHVGRCAQLFEPVQT